MKATFISLTFILIHLLISSSAWAGDPFSGANIYAQYCVSCHGGDGRGEELAGTPSFRGGALMAKSNSDLTSSVKFGRNMMPAFNGVLQDYQIDDVVAYIRTFN